MCYCVRVWGLFAATFNLYLQYVMIMCETVWHLMAKETDSSEWSSLKKKKKKEEIMLGFYFSIMWDTGLMFCSHPEMLSNKKAFKYLFGILSASFNAALK